MYLVIISKRMPSTPAQLRAAKKWRENNREVAIASVYKWREENGDKQRKYARKSMAKNYLWKCATKELNMCLID